MRSRGEEMSKFFVANQQIQNGMITIIGEDVNHITNVLRLQRKDELFVCDKENGVTYKTTITELEKEAVICKIIEKIPDTTESNVRVTIFQGLPKADKMEYIIQKTTELGVKDIVPVRMKRCIVKLEGKDETKKIDRWQKIAEVAAKQSGRDRIPKVENIIHIEQLKEQISNFDLFLIAYEEEKENTLKNELSKLHSNRIKKEVDLFKKMKSEDRFQYYGIKEELTVGGVIGPEGGLDKQEVEILQQNGAKIVTLGKRILRTETAPIAILSNIMYEFDN